MDGNLNLNDLFQSAGNDGTLSKSSLMSLNVKDIGEDIISALGTNINDFVKSEVVLVTLLVDDSGSIGAANNTDLVINGHNTIIDSLGTSVINDDVLIHTRYLCGEILYPYLPLSHAVKMNRNNYKTMCGTPLYDQTVVVLGTVLAKTLDFLNNGIPVRTITIIITDGDDVHSVKHSPKTVKPIVTDMIKTERHIIAGFGINDGETDFKKVFREMGIDDRWILTPQNTQPEIRNAFHIISRSIIKASQSSANFSRLALGGFGG